MEWEKGRRRDLPLAVELFNPVDDKAESEAWTSDREEFGLLVFVDR